MKKTAVLRGAALRRGAHRVAPTSTEPPSLAAEPPALEDELLSWHAGVLDEREANEALDALMARLGGLTGQARLKARIEEVCLRRLLGRMSAAQAEVLHAELTALGDERLLAYLELVLAHTALARRMAEGQRWLEAAQARLLPLLPGADGLRLMRRHALLRLLPAREEAAAPRPLPALLREAALIRLIEARQPPRRAASGEVPRLD